MKVMIGLYVSLLVLQVVRLGLGGFQPDILTIGLLSLTGIIRETSRS